MTRLELEIHDDALAAVNKIKSLNDSGIELIIPEGSILFDNILNLKLISHVAEKNQKIVQFTTTDEAGMEMISMLEEPGTRTMGDYPQKDFETELTASPEKNRFVLKEPKLPRINLTQFNKRAILAGVALATLFGTVFFISKKPVAYTKIVLESQPLTRSLTIKVVAGADTNAEKMILRGQTLESAVEVTDEIATTGEELVGKKAAGKVIIYNKTDEEIKLDKGDKLNYDEKDLIYVLKDNVKVPPKEEQPSSSPSEIVYKLGEAIVDIEAADIGSAYNIDKDETLEVVGYKSSQMTAKTKDDLTGGESKKVKVVSEADKTNLQKKVTDTAKEKATGDIKSKLGRNNQRLIEGSVIAQITKESYNAKVGDETDKLTLTAYASAAGLTYLDSELNSLLDKLVQNIIPAGHDLSEKQREVTTVPLGNSNTSVLSSSEADLQVTLKTFTVTRIDKDELKKSLAGKSVAEAEKVLGGIRNITTYSIGIKPAIPFFKKVPKDLNRINIEIENE
ncbi:MAG: hypothetical protein KatS3mg101_0027 [Patescibacteria group bacterium]|nr:MAG: hypothetical protein KatS3mg101_0027 [Patescibacteria group bacterium]